MKIKIQHYLIVASFFGITACGGGGGGSSGGGNSIVTASSAPATSSVQSVVSSSAQSSLVNLSPEVRIQFPRKDALSLSGYNYMTVSGIAYDDKGIRSVKVNGVTATLNTPSIAQSGDLPATHTYITNWSAMLVFPLGDNPISVDVTDSDGVEVKNAAQPLSIRNRYTPMGTVLDPLNDRMIGFINYGQNFSVDLNTLNSVPLSSVTFGYGMALNKDSTEIFSTKVVNGFLKLYANKLGTNIDKIIANYDLGFDPAKHLWVDSSSGVISPDQKFYFAAVRYVFIQGSENNPVTKILKIDIDSGAVSILKEVDLGGGYSYISNIFYVNNSLIIVHPNYDGSNISELKKIDPQTGEQTNIMTVPQFDLFAINHGNTTVYALTYDRFAIINLVDKTVVQKMFPRQGAEVAFTQLAQLLVDEKRNRLLASNTDGRDIIAIDISSAERSIVLNNGIGDGAGLIWPGYIETTADDKFAYVLDDRLRATDTLFKIDLQTGNRTTVSDLGPYDNQGTYGVALDESNNRIFIAMGLAILMVDLDTGAQKVIASSDVGLGIAMESFITIGDMVYDHQNNRLLVSSGWQNGFVAAIDPVTFNRTILLDSTMGNGPALTSISAMALDGENKKLYVSNTDAEDKTSILAINIETGDRVFLFDQCKNDGGSLYQLVDSYDTKIILDEKSQQLYATSNNEILIKNLASDKCKVINSPADDLALLSDSTLLGLSLGLSQINPYNGERAIISK
jgi:hypothetical protein